MNFADRPLSLSISALSRVEGEGGISIEVEKGKVKSCKLHIFEAPRFFESFLIGRHFYEPPDITARICGICPVAYQVSSTAAIEKGCNVFIPENLWQLRRLLYCGEWIESHSLHVFFLHAPGFLRYPSLMEMAKDYPTEVGWGLQMKKAGNALIRALGGREIHPVNVRVGGFYSLPEKKELKKLLDPLKKGLDNTLAALKWMGSTFSFPPFQRAYRFVALRNDASYPIERGKLYCGQQPVPIEQFENFFKEEQTDYSNALRWLGNDSTPCVAGPLARFNLNYYLLPPFLRDILKQTTLNYPCLNPFQSILVRLVEVAYAFDEAIRLIETYEPGGEPCCIDFKPCASLGQGISEAPRGILYHRYHVDEQGIITGAKIVPPTCFNLVSAEEDLKAWIESHPHDSIENLSADCEQIVRNYDPCISCATHLIKLTFL
ncbi:nickel-dependent hydrogenase large subunit [Candidatus Methylacidiphilum infernorum]|uniref:Nickel-dependent hydrogenase large subunit n=1 Tax=Candidatus Methylacidiphilum infernorum TaxID=511746 RepID=A0ABX7PTG9_9BACT|nr:nickel-dependent hydrogenase large subunit [Candidatus Methylacidiphilum infernorum]QSR85914.1 nickel-dependent hydrogenase large subunit [Candidatus Methylacidiphilum infernorum]